MPPRWDAEVLANDVERLAARGLPRDAFFREVAARIRRIVACDAMCWHTLDPETLLMTSDQPEELLAEGFFTSETIAAAGQRLVASEYMVKDVNTFAAVARRRVPVAILSDAIGRSPHRSPRYQDLMAPAGIPHELRAVFVARGRAWGAVVACRREDRQDFTAADAAVFAQLTGIIAHGIRNSMRYDAAHRAAEDAAPGLIVLNSRDEVELITAPARELFAALRSTVFAVAARARRDARAGRRQPAPIAVPTPSGWLTLHASFPDGPGDGRVAVVLERSQSPHALAVRLEAHGLTPREREIAAMLARGLSTADIAAELVLSPYTVQDHVKSIFDKTDVRSRHELVARVFLEDYLPNLVEGTPVSSSGMFVPRIVAG